MKYIVAPEIFKLFPNLKVGIIIGRNLKIEKTNNELKDLINKNITTFLEKVRLNDLADFKNISAWREIYRKIGINPKKHRPTAEAFLGRVQKTGNCPNINTVVDAYLAVELLYMLPIGGYDLDKISGDIILRISSGGEEFIPIGGDKIEFTEQNEIIYADNEKVLTRMWNYRDSDISKINIESKSIILASEICTDYIDDHDLELTIMKIKEYLQMYCSGEYHIYFIDINTPEVKL